MTKEEANARLTELAGQVQPLLQEMANLAREHSLTYNMELDPIGRYTTHLQVNNYTDYQLETWTSSNYQDDWMDSGC